MKKEDYQKSKFFGKVSTSELDLLMAETAEIRSDIEGKDKNIGKYRTAGYFLELAKIIEKRRLSEI